MQGARRRRDPALDPFPAQEAAVRPCAWPGCACAGEFRAPRSRDALRDYHWFCLDHVRAYNQSWDYFAGWTREAIEAHQRADVTWHRPTWRPASAGDPLHGLGDPFGLFDDDPAFRRGPEERTPRHGARPGSEEERMLAVMGLARGATRVELKRRYKELAKRHHPDLHGGDKAAEERLKLINVAYTYLRDSGLFT